MANLTLPEMLCVEPLSSPYSLLPRLQTYAIATVLLLPLPRGWLFRAALAAFTTRTAIFAIDAAVQLNRLSKPINPATLSAAPLDVLVVLEMMGLAAAMAVWLLLVSSRGGESAARDLVRLWAAVVSVGAILAFVAVAKFGRQTLQDADIGKPYTTCTGETMYSDWLLGFPLQDVKVLGTTAWKIGFLEVRVGVPGLVMASMALLALVLPRQMASRINGSRPAAAELPVDIEQHGLSDAPIKEDRSQSPLWRVLGTLVALAVPAMVLLMVISAEQYFNTMTHGMPQAEEMSSVGQWGGFAAMGIVAAATLLNAVGKGTGLKQGGGDTNWSQEHTL